MAYTTAQRIKESSAIISRTMPTFNMKKAAITYAERLSWAVLPLHSIENGRCTCGRSGCTSSGKHPRTMHGVQDATKDLATITRWWDMWPNANIGIATGTISGFFVLDIDGEEGEDSLAELEGQYGALPDTVEQLTGHGRHILFKQPQGIDVRPKVALLSGLDIRGDGGYIVAAPSLHISGKRYAWEVEHHPLSTPIVEAPQWLLELIIGQGDRETAATAGPNEWATALDELVEGKRNDGLYRYACHLLAHGLSAVEAVKIVRAINNAYAKPPLDKAELDRTLQSAIEWKAKNDGRR